MLGLDKILIFSHIYSIGPFLKRKEKRMDKLWREFKFHTLAFIVFMAGGPLLAWQYLPGGRGDKDLNMVACCLVAAATGILSLAFFKQGVHADAASVNDAHK